jgi:hypothetical protein
MARTPRASVSKTSGQGISRLSYQKGYHAAGDARVKGRVAVDMEEPKKGGGGKSYAKTKKQADHFNADDFLEPYSGKPAKGDVSFAERGPKRWK